MQFGTLSATFLVAAALALAGPGSPVLAQAGLKAADANLAYWKQTDEGRWEKAA